MIGLGESIEEAKRTGAAALLVLCGLAALVVFTRSEVRAAQAMPDHVTVPWSHVGYPSGHGVFMRVRVQAPTGAIQHLSGGSPSPSAESGAAWDCGVVVEPDGEGREQVAALFRWSGVVLEQRRATEDPLLECWRSQ